MTHCLGDTGWALRVRERSSVCWQHLHRPALVDSEKRASLCPHTCWAAQEAGPQHGLAGKDQPGRRLGRRPLPGRAAEQKLGRSLLAQPEVTQGGGSPLPAPHPRWLLTSTEVLRRGSFLDFFVFLICGDGGERLSKEINLDTWPCICKGLRVVLLLQGVELGHRSHVLWLSGPERY